MGARHTPGRTPGQLNSVVEGSEGAFVAALNGLKAVGGNEVEPVDVAGFNSKTAIVAAPVTIHRVRSAPFINE